MRAYSVLQGAHPFFFKGNHIGVLISHGFVGTPQSVAFLGKCIAAQGYTVYAPRLKGHGTHYEDMEAYTYHDWLNSLEDGYQLLREHCNKIFVIGQSMGGTLALHLTSKHPSIAGVILINAAMTSIPGMDAFNSIHKPRFIEEGAPDIKDKSVFEITYAKAPIKAIHQVLGLMEDTRARLANITCPLLVFKSKEDHVVPPANSDYIMNQVQSPLKETVTLYNSYHVASMDFDKEFVAEKCCTFIKKFQMNGREIKIL
ncbi:alpha/beta fold hydrolase [Ectobacillus sp. JY-23]|uniref:alpha/beta hydrolase n=1 Tax=Ectobacillus sp. JY-23 TaxID=2933872 RepID=UPI001FF416E9|nr:alpha/beta fold hydrolase [Ectobacillus sp. JY-23]UOY91998.1 alpha/beta fold hydrolase [Ectobacillus sp. JY-23]